MCLPGRRCCTPCCTVVQQEVHQSFVDQLTPQDEQDTRPEESTEPEEYDEVPVYHDLDQPITDAPSVNIQTEVPQDEDQDHPTTQSSDIAQVLQNSKHLGKQRTSCDLIFFHIVVQI